MGHIILAIGLNGRWANSPRAHTYYNNEQVFPNWKHLLLIDHLSEGIQIFLIVSDKCFWLIEYLTIISVQQHQSFYRQQITLTGMMGIGRILHTHKSFSYCWCERIIHKVRTVLQTYSLHHALHTHFFFTDCQYQTRHILRRRSISLILGSRLQHLMKASSLANQGVFKSPWRYLCFFRLLGDTCLYVQKLGRRCAHTLPFMCTYFVMA